MDNSLLDVRDNNHKYIVVDRRDLVNQISKVGNNVNQIAHVANASQTVSEYKIMQIKDYMKDIYNLLMEVLNKWQ